MAQFLLILPLLIISTFAAPTELPLTTIAKGSYIRSIQLADSSLLSCNTPGFQAINIYKDTKLFSTVPNPSYPNITGTDYTDCFLFTSSNINNAILLTARYHTGCIGAHLVKGNSCTYYSLPTWISKDNGKTWSSLSNDFNISYPSNDVQNCGIWEPFIYEIKGLDGSINLVYFYATEYLDSNKKKQQNIVSQICQVSEDNYKFICDSDVTVVSSTGSYDELPSVTQLNNGTIIAAMDTNYPCTTGHTWNTTNSVVISYDGGKTYNESTRQIIYDLYHNRTWSAISSGIASNDDIIVLTSMLMTGISAFDTQYVIYTVSTDGVNWNQYKVVSTEEAYWPNVYVVNKKDLYIEMNIHGESGNAVSVRTTNPITG
eukprot:265476_1